MCRYELMLSCWRESPDERPTFEELRSSLAYELEQSKESYGEVFFSWKNEALM